MINDSSIELVRELKSLYQRHIDSFVFSDYLNDENRINELFEKLIELVEYSNFERTEDWEEECREALKLNDRLVDIIRDRKVLMSRTRQVNYSSNAAIESYYFDQKR